MKKLRLVLLALFCAVMAGCASSGSSERECIEAMRSSKWWRSQRMADGAGIYAVGNSAISNRVAAENSARLSARSNLADMVRVSLGYIAENSGASGAELPQNLTLAGSRQVDLYAEGGRVYVLMFQPYGDLVRGVRDSASGAGDERLQKLMEGLGVKEFKAALEKSGAAK